MRFYKFSAIYWLGYSDNDDNRSTEGIVVAENYEGALSKLEKRLYHLVSISLTEWDGDTDFIFVPGTAVDKLFKEADYE